MNIRTELMLHRFLVMVFLCASCMLFYVFLEPKYTVPYILNSKESDAFKKEAFDSVKKYLINNDPNRVAKIQQRGKYWVLYNYIKASKTFLPHESVTYTTHGDFTFLDNLALLIERWRGPISLALYAPGYDFQSTIKSIRHLRDCTTTLVKVFVTFHIFFDDKHFPDKIPTSDLLLSNEMHRCTKLPPHLRIASNKTYRSSKKLLYPINVARNVAKEMAQTHFVLASDIELYPSVNIIPNFLDMINNKIGNFGPNPVVFPLNLFEVETNTKIPATKTELQKMITDKKAVTFHKRICPDCHQTPLYHEWIKAVETEGLHVFHVGKRQDSFQQWEPIFIGTRNDPSYDERMMWEGKNDKMSQGYILCVKDYDMMILDNAFLVHKPGIKDLQFSNDPRRFYIRKSQNFLRNTVVRELNILYGSRNGCVI